MDGEDLWLPNAWASYDDGTMRISQTQAVGLATTATAATVAGLWLHAGGGRATPAGFLQYAAVAVGTAALGSFIL